MALVGFVYLAPKQVIVALGALLMADLAVAAGDCEPLSHADFADRIHASLDAIQRADVPGHQAIVRAPKVRRMQRADARLFRLPPLCGEARGYNLHAAVVIGRGNRDGLERLCR